MSASIACTQCGTRSDYAPESLFLSLHTGGPDDVIMLLRFECLACGRSSTQQVNELFAEALTDIGATTIAVGPCPEMEENLELRTGSSIPLGWVETFASMSIGSFNRLAAREIEEIRG